MDHHHPGHEDDESAVSPDCKCSWEDGEPPDECACSSGDEEPPSLVPDCTCPRDELGLVIHVDKCPLFKNETFTKPSSSCECDEPPASPTPPNDNFCCFCFNDMCRCVKSGREALEEWRKNRPTGPMPAVLEASHPLMQKFQDTLTRFLEKENEIALKEIDDLRESLQTSKKSYDAELEEIYKGDHETNAQRSMIEEYEGAILKMRQERIDAENAAKEWNEKYKKAKEQHEQDVVSDREAIEEVEALTSLVRQLEKWREETESDLTVSQRMSSKMRAEKRVLAKEKRDLDMIIFSLNNEVWKLESKMELYKQQLEIKNKELGKTTDRVTGYQTELEDLELDQRRLMSLWNSVIVNIKQRDNVFNSVREDYSEMQENYRTLHHNLDVTRKTILEEMTKSKELTMHKDKIIYESTAATKNFELEETKREGLEIQVAELRESIELTERDINMIKMENQAMQNILTSIEKEWERRCEQKLKLENEILANLQDCLLNDKAVDAMAKGIKNMREMTRKLELSLMEMENQHAKMMLEIEIHRGRYENNKIILEKNLEKVRAKEKELDMMEQKCNHQQVLMTRKQREFDIVSKRYYELKDTYAGKSPQQARVEELESQIKKLRERTEELQQEWLRLQAHVVKLTQHDQKVVYDIGLINKQIQICEQKIMYYMGSLEKLRVDRVKVDRAMRELRGRLEMLARARRDVTERNQSLQHANMSITHEYTANLKDAESKLMEMEEDIENIEKKKSELTQELDKYQKEALIWQRKGILAVELKRNMKAAKSAAGEIGLMKKEIHKMKVRRDQLHRTTEKLSEDLVWYVTRRETALEKSRATAAVERAYGSKGTSQSVYHHKLRLAKADLARVTKELEDAKSHLSDLHKDRTRIVNEMKETSAKNHELEEQVATMLRDIMDAERDKQWLLERVVRCQRIGKELQQAVKRQSLRVAKPKNQVLSEYEMARLLNNRIKHVVDTLMKNYPYLHDKLEVVMNTLTLYAPGDLPVMAAECISTGDYCVIQEEPETEEEPQRESCSCEPCPCD